VTGRLGGLQSQFGYTGSGYNNSRRCREWNPGRPIRSQSAVIVTGKIIIIIIIAVVGLKIICALRALFESLILCDF
jgi:hypothetical protein